MAVSPGVTDADGAASAPSPAPASPAAAETAGALDGTVETRGIEPVPDHERRGRVRELFPTWVAANISVLLLTMGAGLVVFNGLNFWQVLLAAAIAGGISFGLVGLLSVSGKWGGAPGAMLSRATFGVRGNYFPGMILWVARFGWETINAVTGAYAVLTVLRLLFGVRSSTPLIAVTLLLFVGVTFVVSGMGRKVLNLCNTWSTYLFGLFTVLVLGYLVTTMDWGAVFSRPAGGTAMFIAGIGTIAAGGISWIPTGPDFARYLPHSAEGRKIFGTTLSGALLVLVPMVLMGGVMSVKDPALAKTDDPVSFLGEALPMWLAVPYLVVALIGMVLINSLSMYSAGFTAQTMGVKLPRAWAVSINAGISLVGGLLLMLVAKSFYGSFISFLSLLAVSFSAWVGVYGIDMLRRRNRTVRYDPAGLLDTSRSSRYWYVGGYCWQAMTAWGVALLLGLGFTKCDWFTGPLVSTWIGENGLGWAATALLAALLHAALPVPREGAAPAPVPAPRTEEASAGTHRD
ncbi:allantoin permease [Streptomyces qinglanensis]|uniref:Allantoin permease n=1 Tax=Streptomyces qinglanensis TaxID=943816 RepID=A0A1E7K6C2_9ACTN|nr:MULTISPECIES: cytosine permease [Streptomyces]OEU99463.1 allantoin permease [Streptomyces qinglanensis]OEV25527.1 allantoin permease [Streptomyces nanshensis]